MTSEDDLPPYLPLSTPIEVRLVGLHPDGVNDWTVVLAVRGLDHLEPLALAAASASLRDRLLDDPPGFFAAAGWGELDAPAPRKGDGIEVVILMLVEGVTTLFDD